MIWGSFLIAAAALKTPTINGYNAQGGNLTFEGSEFGLFNVESELFRDSSSA